jgi:hypothetical protein
MQDTVEFEKAAQAIRLCEYNGLTGTAEALKKVLADLGQVEFIAQKSQFNNVAET